MSTDAERPESEGEILARHKMIVEGLSDVRRTNWSVWGASIYDSKCLTSKGKQVAFWAVEILKQTLKDDFFQRVVAWSERMQKISPDLPPDPHPIMLLGLWPTNDAPWVYANLFRLAASIQFFNQIQAQIRIRRVLNNLRQSGDPIKWTSTSLQLEIAALGLKAGWDIFFEPPLGNGRPADVQLIKGTRELLVETTSMRLSDEDRKKIIFSRQLSWQVLNIEWQYNVQISGSIEGIALKDETTKTQFLSDIEKAAVATNKDRESRQVSGPENILITIAPSSEAILGERWEIIGDPIGKNILGRLITALRQKNTKAEGSRMPV